MLTLLAMLVACRGPDTPPSSTPTAPATQPEPSPSTATGITLLPTADTHAQNGTGDTSRPPTGDTSTTDTSTGHTGHTATTGHTGPATGLTVLPTAHTGSSAATGDTGLAPTADTSDQGPTADTGPCGVLPTGLPYDTDTDPPITDTGHVCQPLVPHPGCHTEDWVLQTDGIYAQTARAVTSLPDGDLVVVGNSQADFTVATGRADEATVTQCGIDYKGFILKVGIDGTVRWARPLLDSCDYAEVLDIETTPDGRLLAWGLYWNVPATWHLAWLRPKTCPHPMGETTGGPSSMQTASWNSSTAFRFPGATTTLPSTISPWRRMERSMRRGSSPTR